MRRRRLSWPRAALAAAIAAGAMLAVSALGQPPSSDPIGDLIARDSGLDYGRAGTFETEYLQPLLRASCPSGVNRIEPSAIDLKATPVPLAGLNPFRKDVGSLNFVAGFHLTSSDTRFGGLSGLDLRDDGGLLAVSDTGDFVWLDLAADGVAPKTARIAGMLDDKGAAPARKSDADAEGLALHGDVAIVSFESDHRVLGYDLGGCGAAARGAPVRFGGFSGPMAKAFADKNMKVAPNQGLEGLAVTPDWMLLVGIETRSGDSSAVSARAIEAAPVFDLAIGKDAPELVGLDVLAAGEGGRDLRLYSLHRSSNALASNVITIVETKLAATLDQSNLPARVISEIDERSRQRFRATSSRVLAEMNVFVTIDNYEGIAAMQLPDGRVRLFIVSDDNFSKSQRTLLMIYDIRQ